MRPSTRGVIVPAARLLPLLATYMGHVSIVSTQYYLPFVEALAAAAAARFADRCGQLLEATSAPGGAP